MKEKEKERKKRKKLLYYTVKLQLESGAISA